MEFFNNSHFKHSTVHYEFSLILGTLNFKSSLQAWLLLTQLFINTMFTAIFPKIGLQQALYLMRWQSSLKRLTSKRSTFATPPAPEQRAVAASLTAPRPNTRTASWEAGRASPTSTPGWWVPNSYLFPEPHHVGWESQPHEYPWMVGP